MRIQKVLSRKYKSKEYSKYILVLPEKEIKKSGFKEGEELEAETKKGEIRLKSRT
ncbi:MAG: hypothetical protein Q8N63_07365 [Nanoarchaeota archaeon]|nr:hypothetical protein [Nanoarchaeota archaeon]